MTLFTRLLNLLPGRRRAIEAETQAELQALRELVEPGDTREFGNFTQAAENAREQWGIGWLEQFARDVRMAYRTLSKSPGYSVTCIAVLALGIGANTAIFTVVEAVILRPLQYPNADRLVYVWQKIPSLPEPIGPRMQSPRSVYEEWQKQTDIFTDLAAYQEQSLNEVGVERPRTLSAGYASTNLFPLLGSRAAIGRLFSAEEQQKSADRVVVLSDSYFEKRFHRDASAIGKSITLGDSDYTIIGALPFTFHLPRMYQSDEEKKPDLWLPLSRLWKTPADEKAWNLFVIGQLRIGLQLDQARAAVSGLQAHLNKSDSERFALSEASVFPLKVEGQSEDLNLGLYILLGAVGFLLLIGCSNLANLTIARATRRAREISIRRALGASRGRIILQLLTESFLVAVAGSAAGLLLAQVTLESLIRMKWNVPQPEDLQLNLPVLAFTGAVGLLTTLLFGLAPAISASRVSVNETLKRRGGGGASATLRGSRQWLTAAEVCFAVILLCGAGLMLRSFVKLVRIGLGFNTHSLTVADMELPDLRYPNAASRDRFYKNVLAKARAIPGVVSAGVATTVPMRSINFSTFAFADRPKPQLKDAPSSDNGHVSIEYFRVMELPIRAGRDFIEADVAQNLRGNGDGVAIINQAFADTFFKEQNPLGHRLLFDNDRPFQIVGIATNFLAMGATEEARPEVFVAGVDTPKSLLLLRTSVPPETISDEVRAMLLSLDREIPVVKISSMDQSINEMAADSWSVIVLLSIFAGLALLLAMIGVYSVLANLVASRTREIGIRMALGATREGIGRMVAGQSLRPVLGGLVVGLIASLGLSYMMRSELYGVVSPSDPITFTLVIAAVMIVAPLAVWGPVRRATRVECTVALREE